MTRAGDTDRCDVCGGRIVVIHDPRVISLTAGVWVHTGRFRRWRNHGARPS